MKLLFSSDDHADPSVGHQHPVRQEKEQALKMVLALVNVIYMYMYYINTVTLHHICR